MLLEDYESFPKRFGFFYSYGTAAALTRLNLCRYLTEIEAKKLRFVQSDFGCNTVYRPSWCPKFETIPKEGLISACGTSGLDMPSNDSNFRTSRISVRK